MKKLFFYVFIIHVILNEIATNPAHSFVICTLAHDTKRSALLINVTTWRPSLKKPLQTTLAIPNSHLAPEVEFHD